MPADRTKPRSRKAKAHGKANTGQKIPKYVFKLGPGQDVDDQDHKIACPICSKGRHPLYPITLVARMMRFHFSRFHRDLFSTYFDGEPADLRICPYQDTCADKSFIRIAEVNDHLNEVHDEYSKDWSLSFNKMKRKRVDHLLGAFTREARELNDLKCRLRNAEDWIRQSDPAYRSCHGLNEGRCYEEDPSRVTHKHYKGQQKVDIAQRLVEMRIDADAEGKSLNGKKATWGEVVDEIEKMANFQGVTQLAQESQGDLQ